MELYITTFDERIFREQNSEHEGSSFFLTKLDPKDPGEKMSHWQTLRSENRKRSFRKDLLQKLMMILLGSPYVKSNNLATAWINSAYVNQDLDLMLTYAEWWNETYNHDQKIWAHREKIFDKILFVESFILGKDHPFMEVK